MLKEGFVGMRKGIREDNNSRYGLSSLYMCIYIHEILKKIYYITKGLIKIYFRDNAVL